LGSLAKAALISVALVSETVDFSCSTSALMAGFLALRKGCDS
jgi:hypothetical protein